MSGYHKYHKVSAMLGGGLSSVRVASRQAKDQMRSREMKRRLDDLVRLNRAAADGLRQTVGKQAQPGAGSDAPRQTPAS